MQRDRDYVEKKKYCGFTLAGLDYDTFFPEMDDLLY